MMSMQKKFLGNVGTMNFLNQYLTVFSMSLFYERTQKFISGRKRNVKNGLSNTFLAYSTWFIYILKSLLFTPPNAAESSTKLKDAESILP